MIVKLILHPESKSILIKNEAGKRLYFSDQPKDIELAKKLLAVIPEGATVAEQRFVGYFQAYFKNKVVQLTKRARGYSW